MGREVVATCRWRGDVGEAKLLLESDALILRGGMRGRIAREAIESATVRDGDLVVVAGDAVLVAELGVVAAERWARAIMAAPVPLAHKLGVDAERRAFVVGAVDDAALVAALDGVVTVVPDEAAVVVAMVRDAAALAAALAVAQGAARPVWLVHEKGRTAALGDAVWGRFPGLERFRSLIFGVFVIVR